MLYSTLPARSSAIALAVSAMLASPLVFAQVEDVTELDPVVITATRTAETADATLASVSVVEREEIERTQAQSTADVLRGLPGVALSNSGGPGQPTSLFLRGTNADHTLVLIDGVKVGSATLGSTPWQNIPVNQIDRVELVRGPRSSLYGSEAIGGVVQIFTRGGRYPGADGLTPRFSVAAGTYNTARIDGGLNAAVTTGAGEGWIDASLGFEQTAGFNACNGFPGGPPFIGCGVYEFDRDGFSNSNGAVRGGWRFSDELELGVNFLRSESETDYDGSFFSGNRNESAVQVAGGRLVARPLDIWTSTLAFSRNWDDQKIFYQDAYLNRFDTKRDALSWQNDLELVAGQLLTLGLDMQRDLVDTQPVFDVTSRDNRGVFGQYLGGFGDHDLQASLRYDDNSQFGGQTTGGLGWGHGFANGLRLNASYGTAFKAPDFSELYFPFFGNPDLKPETSWSAELGVSGPIDTGLISGDWALNAYHTEIDDLIAFDAASQQAGNIDRARIQGLEFWTTLDVDGWLHNFNVTLLDPRNQSDDADNGNLLARRPQQTVRLDMDKRFGRIGLGYTLFYSGRSFDDIANDVRLDEYALFDLRADYALTDSLRVQGSVRNLFDANYETAAGYNQPGASFLLTLRYEPQLAE